MRSMILPAVGILGFTVLAVTRVEPPTDLGSWIDGPLAGEVVLAMDNDGDAVVVGTRRGLFRVRGDGSSQHLDKVDGPVHTVAAQADGELWAGTDDGLVVVDGGSVKTLAFAGEAVMDLDVGQGTAVAGTDSGVHRMTSDGSWQRAWPAIDQPGTAVGAVLRAPRGLVFAHPQGLALLRPSGVVEIIVPAVSVVALGQWSDDGPLWAGTRGEPLLLRSTDEGSSWTPRSTGLGYTSVRAVAIDPATDGELLVGGTGLADGNGNAGIQRSNDDGTTWTAVQGRLTNTHVYALATRIEPLRVNLRLAGTNAAASLPLPVSTTRWYAGTNGGGVSTHRPDVAALHVLGAAAPFLSVLEPLWGGALLLIVLVTAYEHLRRSRQPTPRGPPTPLRATDRIPTDHSHVTPN
ncbi:MAG: hypothetical protein WA892_02365 [Ornithinimicrobium sp.]